MTTSNDKADLLALRLLITVWSAILLMLALLSPAHAADLEAGKEAYRRGDVPSALRELRPLAEQGDAEAQALGSCTPRARVCRRTTLKPMPG